MQAVEPAELYFPIPQMRQTEEDVAADVVECLPGPQSTQAEMETEAVFSLYLPAMQSVQTVATAKLDHFPCSQLLQTEEDVAAAPAVEYLPGPQSTQAEMETEAVFSLYLPAMQLTHESDPTESLHFPRAQARQGEPFTGL